MSRGPSESKQQAVLRADAVCFVRVATLCVMLPLMLCCPARALGYTLDVAVSFCLS